MKISPKCQTWVKKEVAEVDVRKHEYTNGTRDKISMFRIDFGAKIRQDDGSLKLVLIELQKTWLETETLRFRQYLGTQYANPDNIDKESGENGYGIPMIAVYLLGHRVGDIKEPVLYVSHKSYDYNGNEVTEGIPDPFVESLTHDSIIVQIPLLHGHVNNRLAKVLSVFDQKNKNKHNHQELNINEDDYMGDPEMEHILHRLLSAASDTELRQAMNVEDEYFSAIENRDTAIMMRDQRIAEQDAQLEQNKVQLEQNKAQLEQNKVQLEQNKVQLEQNKAQLEQKETALLVSAKAMKAAGMSPEQISEMTTLPLEVVIGQ